MEAKHTAAVPSGDEGRERVDDERGADEIDFEDGAPGRHRRGHAGSMRDAPQLAVLGDERELRDGGSIGDIERQRHDVRLYAELVLDGLEVRDITVDHDERVDRVHHPARAGQAHPPARSRDHSHRAAAHRCDPIPRTLITVDASH